MSDKFKNKYRIPSARLQTWDYGANGAYFITICTQNREHFFGQIVETPLIASPPPNQGVAEMQLNEIGKLAEQFWMEIPNHFPFIELGNFVVMPNHVHGILIVGKMDDMDRRDGRDAVDRRDAVVETRLIASLPENNKPGGFAGDKNPMFHENISRVCRWYKGRCTFEIRKIHADFEWQSRFHDHIIRNAESFERIQYYIENNPSNWNNDKLNG
jgi:putative transposase